jgi:hypothetical protein
MVASVIGEEAACLDLAKKVATELVPEVAETHLDSFQARFPAEAYIG